MSSPHETGNAGRLDEKKEKHPRADPKHARPQPVVEDALDLVDDSGEDESQPRSQSLRDGIEATLQMGGETRRGGSRGPVEYADHTLSTASSSFFSHTRSSAMTAGLSGTHAKYSLANLDKSVEALVFTSTPPPAQGPPQQRSQPTQHPVSSSSAPQTHSATIDTPSLTSRHKSHSEKKNSSSALLFRSSDSLGTMPPNPTEAAAHMGQRPQDTRTPVVKSKMPVAGAQPPSSPFASPPLSQIPRRLPPRQGRGQSSLERDPLCVADELTATMEHAVHIPAALRGPGRRTMFDIMLQRQRSDEKLSAVHQERDSTRRVGPTSRLREQPGVGVAAAVVAAAAPRHASAVQALLFPNGIAVDTTGSGSAVVPTTNDARAEVQEAMSTSQVAEVDLRRSLRHLLPSVRAQAAATLQGRAEAHRAERLRTQAELADDISDFSESGADDNEENDEANLRVGEVKESKGMASLSGEDCGAPPPPLQGGRSAMSTFLSQVVGPQGPTPHDNDKTRALAMKANVNSKVQRTSTTITALLREDPEARQADQDVAARGHRGGGGVRMDELLSMDSSPMTIKRELATAGRTRNSVVAILEDEEDRNDDKVRAQAQRHTYTHASEGRRAVALDELVEDARHPDKDALWPPSQPTSRASSLDSDASSSSSLASRRAKPSKIYVDALADISAEEGDDEVADCPGVTGRSTQGQRRTVRAVEAMWKSVCHALSSLVNRYVLTQRKAADLRAQDDREDGEKDAGESEANAQNTCMPSCAVDQIDGTLRWTELSCDTRLRVRLCVLTETNTASAFAKPPALAMASLGPITNNNNNNNRSGSGVSAAGAQSLQAPRRGPMNAVGGAATAFCLPAHVQLGPPRPPPFFSNFLSHKNAERLGGVLATTGGLGRGSVSLRPPHVSARNQNEESDEDDNASHETHELTQAVDVSKMNASAISMVYRIVEMFQAVLLGRIRSYAQTRPQPTTTFTRCGDDADGQNHGEAAQADASGACDASATPSSTGLAAPRQVRDIMAWGEAAALALEVSHRHQGVQNNTTTRDSGDEQANVFTVSVRPEQLPSQRLLRRLADNPTALRAMLYLRSTFNEWTCTPRTTPSTHAQSRDVLGTANTATPPPPPPPPSSSSSSVSALPSCTREMTAAAMNGIDVHLRVHAIDGAFGLVRVKGELEFVSRAARAHFWPPDVAQVYTDDQVRTLLTHAQGRGWTLLLPATIADAVPLPLHECIYLALPFVVVPSQRLLLSSYCVTSDALLSRSALALDHIIMTALQSGQRTVPHRRRGSNSRERGEGEDEEDEGGERPRGTRRNGTPLTPTQQRLKRPRTCEDDPSPSRISNAVPLPSSSPLAAAVRVVGGPRRSQPTTTPPREARTPYRLSPLSIEQYSPSRKRALSVSLITPERARGGATHAYGEEELRGEEEVERECLSFSRDRQPSITPYRNGFYDPLAVGGLRAAGGDGTDSRTYVKLELDAEAMHGERGTRAQSRSLADTQTTSSQALTGLSHAAHCAATTTAASTSHQNASTTTTDAAGSLLSQTEIQSSWAGLDPLGASFHRGPDPRWDVPLEILLALVHFPRDQACESLSVRGTQREGGETGRTISPIGTAGRRGVCAVNEEEEDEDLYEDVSFSALERGRSLPGQISSSSIAIDTPRSGHVSQNGDGGRELTLTRSISSEVADRVENTGQRPGQLNSATPRSVSSLFPDVFLGTEE